MKGRAKRGCNPGSCDFTNRISWWIDPIINLVVISLAIFHDDCADFGFHSTCVIGQLQLRTMILDVSSGYGCCLPDSKNQNQEKPTNAESGNSHDGDIRQISKTHCISVCRSPLKNRNGTYPFFFAAIYSSISSWAITIHLLVGVVLSLEFGASKVHRCLLGTGNPDIFMLRQWTLGCKTAASICIFFVLMKLKDLCWCPRW